MPNAPDPTTPTPTAPHGAALRGLPLTPSSSTRTGRFGRMFRHVPVYSHKPSTLVELGSKMIQPLEDGMLDDPLDDPEPDPDENRSKLDGEFRLPSGYTYFGQFVDHDITFDPVSSLTRQNDPDALTDFRTPRFDLDSLYGTGPSDQPYLYVQPDGVELLLGESRSKNPVVAGPDLPRGPNGRALIGDPRNDENVIISQLQVVFIRFHNAVVKRLVKQDTTLADRHDDLFKRAQQQVRWHYQWVVVHDFLRRLVGDEVIRDILRLEDYKVPGGSRTLVRPRLLFYEWKVQPFMPVEFSAAAYRFGHSIVRPTYLINDVIKGGVVKNAHRIPVLSQDPRNVKRLTNLNGFGPLPDDAGVQWKYFLSGVDGDSSNPNGITLPQPSYKIDPELGHPLGALPDSVAEAQPLFAGIPASEAQSLAVRNLLRGQALGLPAGQDVARAMGIDPLDGDVPAELELSADARADLRGRWPLWYYVLREAQCEARSAHLGPVGGRIVAEVLIGLLSGDPMSYLSVDPIWMPWLPAREDGTFTLTDLVNLALRG